MKLKIIIGLYAGILLFSGCASNTSVVAGQSAAVNAESATKGINNEEPNVNDAHLDDTIISENIWILMSMSQILKLREVMITNISYR